MLMYHRIIANSRVACLSNAAVVMSRNPFRRLGRPPMIDISKTRQITSLGIDDSELKIENRELVIRIRPIG